VTDLLAGSIEQLVVYAPVWGFFLIFFFMTVESSFIPFPSEVVMIPAGFLAARGELTLGAPAADLALAIVAGTAGSLAGAWINYLLAARLGQPFLLAYGKYFFLPPDALHRAEELFRAYGAGATFFCRLLPAIRQLISIPAGLSRMNPAAFTLWTGLGAGLWVIVLALVGWAFGQSTTDLTYPEMVHQGKDALGRHLIWLVPTCLVGLTGYVLLSKRIMRRAA
jgi:membrane protein DedA with SNARE-associated domain